jgi:hypothetical protein
MKNKVKLNIISENLLDSFYKAIQNNRLSSIHIPYSDVVYIRAAIEADTGVRYTLSHVEKAMELEGFDTHNRKRKQSCRK